MVRRLCFFFVFFLFFAACKPVIEGPSEVKELKTTESFWNRKQGVVDLYEFSCNTEKMENRKRILGSYGGGCRPEDQLIIGGCDITSGKSGVPAWVLLNNKKTIREVTCEYIKQAQNHFQESYANGKCTSGFSLNLFYKSKRFALSGEPFFRANVNADHYGKDLKNALIKFHNEYYSKKSEAQLACD